MDIDAFILSHQEQWQRLTHLVGRRRLTVAEVDEVTDLYQLVGGHLAVVRQQAPDPALVSYLSSLVARARLHRTRPARVTWNAPVRFFTHTFPAALYRTRWWWIATSLACVATMVGLTWWLTRNPQGIEAVMSPAEVDRLLNVEFEKYYSEHAAASFSFRVWTNNAWVAALCIALGVLGAPVVSILLQNCHNLALVAALMAMHDRLPFFFGLILPHGLLELTAVFIAAAVGLRLFWSWVRPGQRTRADALATEGRSALGMTLGLAVVLFISGILEAFVTPSGWPTAVRVGIGVAAEVAFFAYVWVLGKRAHLRGTNTDVEQSGTVNVPVS